MGCTVTCSNGAPLDITIVAGVNPDDVNAACNRIEIGESNPDGTYSNFWDVTKEHIEKNDATQCSTCHTKKPNGSYDPVPVGDKGFGDPGKDPDTGFAACNGLRDLQAKSCNGPKAPKDLCEVIGSMIAACDHLATPI